MLSRTDNEPADDLHELVEPSFFTNQGLHEPLLLRLRAAFNASLLRQLKTTVFTLIQPDAIYAGKFRQILDYYMSHGLSVVEIKFLQSPPLRCFEDLYKFNLSLANQQNMLGNWWVNSLIYNKPCAVAVILGCEGGGSVHAKVS